MSAQIPTFDPEDPRLTAYALGELTDHADQLAVERVLQASPEARAALQEIRDVTGALGAEYEQERLLAADSVTALPDVVPMRPAAWPRRLLLAAAVLLLASVARLTVPGWHPQVARLAPGPAAAAPAPPVGAVVADASVARQDPLPSDAVRTLAPADAAATRFTGTLALDRSAVLKDEGSEPRAAAASKALALNDPPLSQGGLGGAPVASAPSVVARSAARRAATPDQPRQAKLIQHAEDKFVAARDHPRATFFPGADVPGDADVRRFIESGHLPPPDAVRTGEWIAAFPSDAQPVPLSLEAASCPWNPQDRLVRIGVKTREEDAEVQVAFDPQAVTAYRLIIGNNDATHRLTTLYEVVPAEQPTPGHASLTVTLRHKISGKNGSEQEDVRTLSYLGAPGDLANASPDFKFAAAVASFAQILQGSPYRGDATLDTTLALAREGIGPDPDGRRAKFVALIQKAQALQKTRGQ